MKVDLVLSGPEGQMWDFTMNYHRLPAHYAMEMATLAASYASLIDNSPGSATTGDKMYSVEFKVTGPDVPEVPKPPATGTPAPSTGESVGGQKGGIVAKAERLLYSQAVALQDAGIKLLGQLQEGAHNEIKSGQRK